jgi:hypothetical protein
MFDSWSWWYLTYLGFFNRSCCSMQITQIIHNNMIWMWFLNFLWHFFINLQNYTTFLKIISFHFFKLVGTLWPSDIVKSPGFFKHGSCFSFFLKLLFFIFYIFSVFLLLLLLFILKIKCFFFTFVFLFIWMQVWSLEKEDTSHS